MNQTSDSDLISRLRNGDISAGGILYERYKRNVYYFVLRLLKDDAAAQDVVQQTFTAMIEKIGSFRQDATMLQWLFAIARNECFMLLRHRRLIPFDGMDEAENSVFDEHTPETVFERHETSAIVHDALGRLKPAYRELMLLRVTEQLSYEEIAAVTHSTVSAVKSKLYKARLALAGELSDCTRKEDRS